MNTRLNDYLYSVWYWSQGGLLRSQIVLEVEMAKL